MALTSLQVRDLSVTGNIKATLRVPGAGANLLGMRAPATGSRGADLPFFPAWLMAGQKKDHWLI